MADLGTRLSRRASTPTLEDDDVTQLIEVPPAAQRLLPRHQLVGDAQDTEMIAAGNGIAALQPVLPSHLTWRNEGDVLANLPADAEVHAVARISMGADVESMQEDTCGASWVHCLLSGSTADDESTSPSCVQWLVVPAASKSAAVTEWNRRKMSGRGKTWPSAQELAIAGVAGVKAVTQHPGELLSVPPHALCIRRAPQGAVMLQWSRASAASCLQTAAQRLPPALPSADQADDPTWRRLQRNPPVALATFLSLVEAVKRADKKKSKRMPSGGKTGKIGKTAGSLDEATRALLSELLEPCRALLNAEHLAESNPNYAKLRDAVPLESIDDHALRLCDHCGASIFNRCVRLTSPRVWERGAHGDKWRLAPEPANYNPLRQKQRTAGDPGDFCLGMRCSGQQATFALPTFACARIEMAALAALEIAPELFVVGKPFPLLTFPP